ncbi:MAG: hypothetical protein E7393_03790 [Ruminococcaceae bacterium]|nr:hypothetical protein [Oscillospiraceae bacterium]
MKAAIIHYEPVFSRLDQSLFLKRTMRQIKSEIKTEDIKIPIYLLPICGENPSKKAIEKFCSYLKKEQIKKIIITNQASSVLKNFSLLEKNFSFFYGDTIIKYKIKDILRKYALLKNLELSKETVVIETDNPNKAKELIAKINQMVRKIKIETKDADKFKSLTEYFLQEYGLFIEINKKNDKHGIIIQLDSMKEKKDSLRLYTEKNNNNQIIFNCKNHFNQIKKYLTLNQKTLELLIFQKYGTINEQNCRRFCKDYHIRVSNFKNND